MTARAAILAALLVVSAAAGVSCAAAGTDAEDFGVVSADISTTGSDGATYSLPSTAVLTLSTAGGSTTTVPLSSATATETFSVPPGTYAATLSQTGGDGGATWTLGRAGDGGATSIQAVLTDSMPLSISVAAWQVTPVVFHFTTPNLGNVQFGNGNLGVGIALDAGGFPVSTAKITGTATMSVDSLDGGYPGLDASARVDAAALDRSFHFTGTVSVPYTLSLTRSGGWTFAADQACAPVTGTASSTAGNAAMAAVFTEASGGTGTLCFGDPSLSGAFSARLARTGAPKTTTLKSDLPGGGTYEVAVSGIAPEVFDGTTLRLGSLPEPFSAHDVHVEETVSAGGTVLAYVDGVPGETASVTLTK